MQEYTGDKNIVERGFTLVEILVVIAILGILAMVVVFSVEGVVDRGHKNACTTEVSIVNTATQAYYANDTSIPPAYPAGPLSQLGTQLRSAGLISASSVIPSSATVDHSPTYDSSTGTYTAAC